MVLMHSIFRNSALLLLWSDSICVICKKQKISEILINVTRKKNASYLTERMIQITPSDKLHKESLQRMDDRSMK